MMHYRMWCADPVKKQIKKGCVKILLGEGGRNSKSV